MTNDKIYMGPLRGFTERPFRDAFSKHFHGVDAILAPFIPLVEVDYINPSRLKDILPADERTHLIPQVIGIEANQIIQMAHVFESYGFDEINLNLGCPMPKITRKGRGSGLLKYPERMFAIIQEVISNINIKLSVKTRIGYEDNSLFPELADVFSAFPLASLTVHTRTGAQMYTGSADPEFFAPFVNRFSNTELIYNGDIFCVEDLRRLKELMPQVSSWMIGRGLIRNPFVGEWIKNERNEWARERFLSFHYELNKNIEESSDTTKIHLNRMKGYWTQFRHVYHNQEMIKNKILRTRDVSEFLHNADAIISTADLALPIANP